MIPIFHSREPDEEEATKSCVGNGVSISNSYKRLLVHNIESLSITALL